MTRDTLALLLCRAMEDRGIHVGIDNTYEIISAFTEVIKASLAKGEDVKIRGFGTFTLVTQKAYVGHHPVTGARFDVPEKKVVKFKPSKGLYDEASGV